MDVLIQVLSYINLAGAIHALIQSIVLFWTPKGIRRANRYMALFLLALAVGMANGMIALLGLYDAWPVLAVLMGSVALAYHPLFYLHIRALTAPDRLGKAADWLHGAPFLLGVLVWTAYLGQRSGGSALGGLAGAAARSPWSFVLIAAALQSVAYITAIVRLLRRHSARIKAAYSTIDPVDLGWLRRRLTVFVTIWAVGLALIAVVRLDSRAMVLVGQLVAFLTALNMFAAGYRALLQPETFFGPLEEGPARRYGRSSLSPENAELIRSRLLEWMERERPYLDPEMTLPKLALSLDIPVAHLSRVLNDTLGRNFYEFINQYRVREARRRLASPDAEREKIIAIASECGFNSLATFNRVFKELAGRTPSAYRKAPTSS